MNPQLVNRVVGYLEYGQALALLTRFLGAASREELEAAEQIVSQRDEFTVYTNLSRSVEPRPGVLSERSDAAHDDYARKGIAWLLALARLELAAMVAGFSPDSDAFAKGRSSPYEVAAYVELLEDAMRTHYWSLVRDPTPRAMRPQSTPEPQAIAYVRRATLAIKFVREVRNERQAYLTPAQHAELDTWEGTLRTIQSYLLYDVLGVHDAIVSNRASTELYLQKCGTTREQILADIRAGTAQVHSAGAAAINLLRKELGGGQVGATPPPSAGAGAAANQGAASAPPASPPPAQGGSVKD